MDQKSTNHRTEQQRGQREEIQNFPKYKRIKFSDSQHSFCFFNIKNQKKKPLLAFG